MECCMPPYLVKKAHFTHLEPAKVHANILHLKGDREPSLTLLWLPKSQSRQFAAASITYCYIPLLVKAFSFPGCAPWFFQDQLLQVKATKQG